MIRQSTTDVFVIKCYWAVCLHLILGNNPLKGVGIFRSPPVRDRKDVSTVSRRHQNSLPLFVNENGAVVDFVLSDFGRWKR